MEPSRLYLQLPTEWSPHETSEEIKNGVVEDTIYVNDGNLRSEVLYHSPKSETKNSPFACRASLYTQSWIKNQSDSSKRLLSNLKIASSPHIQTSKKVFSAVNDTLPYLTSPKSFGEWTVEEQTEAVSKLRKLNIPMEDDLIMKIYFLLKKYNKVLCFNECVKYPAMYEVNGSFKEEGTGIRSNQISLELEIHSSKKASLIFRDVAETFIGKGTSKEIWKTFALDEPELRVHSFALLHVNSTNHAVKEERCFNEFKGKSWITKIYNIYYYCVKIEQQPFVQQIIEMKYYPKDLFTVLSSGGITKQTRFSYGIQLMLAIEDFHNRGYIHCDLKPENLLVDEEVLEIFLTDFGLSCTCQDNELHNAMGTPSYMSPEIITKCVDSYSFPLDIWSAGCILWLLLKGTVYPWYEETTKSHPNFLNVLREMNTFDKMKVDSSNPELFLLWNMLRLDPLQRWSASQVLVALRKLENEFNQRLIA